MKVALLSLLVLAAVDQRSLGVGLDVLPEVYTFAARRVHVFPNLRLSGCDRTTCRWVVGTGVEMTAYVSEWDLGINRLEAGSSVEVRQPNEHQAEERAANKDRGANADNAWFGKACLGIVSLILPQETPAEVTAIAERIVSTSARQRDVHVRIGSRGVRFYGMRSAPSGGVARLRCGVVAESF